MMELRRKQTFLEKFSYQKMEKKEFQRLLRKENQHLKENKVDLDLFFRKAYKNLLLSFRKILIVITIR
jgi:hypothetical protein